MGDRLLAMNAAFRKAILKQLLTPEQLEMIGEEERPPIEICMLLTPGLTKRTSELRCAHQKRVTLFTSPLQGGDMGLQMWHHPVYDHITKQMVMDDKYDEMYKMLERMALNCGDISPIEE